MITPTCSSPTALFRFTATLFAMWLVTNQMLAGARERYDAMMIVPVPAGKTVVVDGDLGDWDLSGTASTWYEESMRPAYELKLAFMYDAKALYVSARFTDDTPMMNAHDPEIESNIGWAGDALQIRLCSNPSETYPLDATSFKRDQKKSHANDRICHMTMWYYAPRSEPVLQMLYGMDYHGQIVLRGQESGVAFRKTDEGYCMEARIPWTLLHAQEMTPKANDQIALTAQPLWGTADGTKHAISFFENIRSSGFGFQDSRTWGRGVFCATGNLAIEDKPMSAQEQKKPLSMTLPLPDDQAHTVTAMILDASGKSVRTLQAVEMTKPAGKKFTWEWDGLNDRGQALSAGEYRVKILTHRGVGQKFIASLHNSGTPPYQVDDGTGGWGGDWGNPNAVTTDGKRVYLGWGNCEAGWSFIAVDPKLTDVGGVQKIWGGKTHSSKVIGSIITALTTDGTYLFIARDGWLSYGENAVGHAGIEVVECETGKPVNFPFGKKELFLSNWDSAEASKRRPLFEDIRDNRFGAADGDANLVSIAVRDNMLYAALVYENKVVAADWKTGEIVHEYPTPSPAGVAVTTDGKLIVASAHDLKSLDLASGEWKSLATGVLDNPCNIALDASGNIYVTDQGRAMQVKVFSSAGKPVRTIGKAGGREWIGAYDKNAMLKPIAVAVDDSGKVWVTEDDNSPRRVSVWSNKGELVGDFHGPSCPQNDRDVNPDHPELVNVANVMYRVDYETGKYECVSTLWRPFVKGWDAPGAYALASRYIFRTFNGQQYAFLDHGYADRPGPLMKFDGVSLTEIGSWGRGWAIPMVQRGTQGMLTDPHVILDDAKAAVLYNTRKGEQTLEKSSQLFCHRWIDRNGDSLIQSDEVEIWRGERNQVPDVCRVDREMGLWGMMSTQDVFHVVPESWTESGIPVYPAPNEVTSFCNLGHRPCGSLWPDLDDKAIYTFLQIKGDDRNRGEYAAVVRHDFTGAIQWEYPLLWPKFALDSPFWKPGLVIGADKVLGQANLDSGIKLLAFNGYHGQYHLLTTDGLWVAGLCKDNRYGGSSGANTQYIENFTGTFFRNKDNGKVYLIGGDIDARIWEVTGLETIRTADATLTFTEDDAKLAVACMATKVGNGQKEDVIFAMNPAGKIAIDGSVKDWNLTDAATMTTEDGKTATMALAYDAKNLYAAFVVKDDSPMVNAGLDKTMMFKTGDTCDIMLAADPKADSARKDAAAGDMRIQFTVSEQKPVCIVYEQAGRPQFSAPYKYVSPTGEVEFGRVQEIGDAVIKIERTADGYVLEASVPLASIGFTPAPGMTTKADLGVLFSNKGGSKTILRAYAANKNTAITEDVPSETRLQPAEWGVLNVK